jgi:RNA polymerase sigma-70 factor (ECF subfamily)
VSTALAQAPPVDETRRLYEQHSSRIFGFCLSRLGSREEAEDAVQTTFMNAQRGLGRGVIPQYELAWLFKIAENVCKNRHQSARRRGRLEAVQDLDSLQDVIASPERSTALSLGELTHALGAIPTRQRQALLLREFQGLSYEEIADQLGVSVAAVETLLFRARRSVAQQLERSGAVPRRRRGAVASLFELGRWLFGGGAAPLKVAAAVAAVATTATVATVPLLRDEAPVSSVPQVSTPNVRVPAARPAVSKPKRMNVSTAGTTAPMKPEAVPGSEAPSPAAATQSVHNAPGSALTVTPPPAQSTPTSPVEQVTAPTLPEVTIPSVTVPSVTVPSVTVPSVNVPSVGSVPEIQLPAVQLPGVKLP